MEALRLGNAFPVVSLPVTLPVDRSFISDHQIDRLRIARWLGWKPVEVFDWEAGLAIRLAGR